MEERSARSSRQSLNTKWINDGISNKRISREEMVPDGWIPGRLSFKVKSSNIKLLNKSGDNTRGKKIYNNGYKHAFFFEGKQPDGWIPGKMNGYQGGTGSHRKGKKLKKG